ncbi:MAG: hypothetical protein LUE86_01350 [Clostridiales bacterium]|nr:hypothetical protein [Clostridiales bacterium]
MDDTIGRTFAYMLIGFGFFILAPILIFLNSDITARSYINTAITEFTENARADGVLRKSDYNQLVTRLNASGNTYVIRIEHKSRTAVPAESGNGYETAYRSYNINDIFAVWDGYGEDMEPGTSDDVDGADYWMKDGDYLSISIVSHSSTLGSRVFGSLIGQPQGMKLIASSGGMIGNTGR